jgi:hypothetical protein
MLEVHELEFSEADDADLQELILWEIERENQMWEDEE